MATTYDVVQIHIDGTGDSSGPLLYLKSVAGKSVKLNYTV